MNSRWIYRTPGISDELFVRGNVPMTKEEVRVITLAKARLAPNHVVWDIGAGTGSLSVEAALQATGGFVYAVERSPAGIHLIQSNMKAFGLDNLKIIEGVAPEALDELPNPDRVFVGGSGGHLTGILESVYQRLLPGGRIIVNTITLETASHALELLQQFYGDVDAVQISVARVVKAGASHLLKGMNPVTVLSAEKRANY